MYVCVYVVNIELKQNNVHTTTINNIRAYAFIKPLFMYPLLAYITTKVRKNQRKKKQKYISKK